MTRPIHTQRGFLIVSMLIILGFLAAFGIEWTSALEKNKVKNNAESFYNHVLFLRQQLHAYTTMRYQKGFNINESTIYPSVLSQLVPDFYPACSKADNEAGLCKPYNQTPWGKINSRDYRLVGVGGTPSKPDFYRAELDIKLPPAGDEAYQYERDATLSLFSHIPSIVFDEPNNLITLRIDRPDKAFAYNGLVKRSGDDSTLLGDWDLGGLFGLTNAKDVTLKARNGAQIPVSQHLVSVTKARHGDWVDKPQCISGQVPQYKLAISSVEVDAHTYTLDGGTRPYLIKETGTRWQVGMSTLVTLNSNHRPTTVTTGEALLIASCR
ncbi:pilus assembly FimT family protein [Vibrio splendidus]|uniref:pilus assembly FimT family protein n=1 Tax=Vibrio splendidus TaxID=29497 RepID=UPI003D1140BA